MILVNSAKPYIASPSDLELDLIDHDVLRVWSFIILLVMMLVPEAITMVYSLYRVIMKPQTRVDIPTLLWVRNSFVHLCIFCLGQISVTTLAADFGSVQEAKW